MIELAPDQLESVGGRHHGRERGVARRLHVVARRGSARGVRPQHRAIRAIYRWEGTVHDEPRARVDLHTRTSLVPEIVARTSRDHADYVPCIMALPITDGHADYIRWIHNENNTSRPPNRFAMRSG